MRCKALALHVAMFYSARVTRYLSVESVMAINVHQVGISGPACTVQKPADLFRWPSVGIYGSA